MDEIDRALRQKQSILVVETSGWFGETPEMVFYTYPHMLEEITQAQHAGDLSRLREIFEITGPFVAVTSLGEPSWMCHWLIETTMSQAEPWSFVMAEDGTAFETRLKDRPNRPVYGFSFMKGAYELWHTCLQENLGNPSVLVSYADCGKWLICLSFVSVTEQSPAELFSYFSKHFPTLPRIRPIGISDYQHLSHS